MRHADTVGITTSGHINIGGGDRVGEDICSTPPEHHHPVYPNSSNTGAISGVGTAAGGMGVIVVVGAGQ